MPACVTGIFSRRLRRIQPQPRLDRIAHQELLDLAGHGHREFVDEFDIARDLVVGDLSVTEGADFIGRQRLARSRPDPGAELLAVAIVGDAEDLHVLDLRDGDRGIPRSRADRGSRRRGSPCP